MGAFFVLEFVPLVVDGGVRKVRVDVVGVEVVEEEVVREKASAHS